MTVATGSIADLDGLEGVALRRQWQRGDGAAWTNIPAATGATFTPSAAEVGLRLRVVVTFTDNGGTARAGAVGARPTWSPRPRRRRRPLAPRGAGRRRPPRRRAPTPPAAPLALARAVLPRTLAAPALVPTACR